MKQLFATAVVLVVLTGTAFAHSRHHRSPRPLHKNAPHSYSKHKAAKHSKAIHSQR